MNGNYSIRVPNLGQPRRMLATLRQGIQGYLPAASAATGSAAILANSYFEPFTSNTPLTTGWATFSLTDASSTTGNFTGSVFYSSAFSQYRVHSSRLRVTAVTGTGGDSMNFWMFPSSYAGIVSAPSMRYQIAAGVPGFKDMMLTAGCRPITRVSSVRPHQLLGQSLSEYKINPNSAAALGSAPTTNASVAWFVYYATMDGAVTAGQCYFDFEIEIDVEFFDPITPDS